MPHGKDTTFELDDPAGSLTDISAYVDTSSLQRAIELADTTAYGDEDHTMIAGLANATIPVGGPWDSVLDAVLGTSAERGTARSFRWRPEGDASPSYTGECYISESSTGGPVSDNIVWSGSLQVTGTVTRA